MQQEKNGEKLTPMQMAFYIVISIFINALGNGLTVALNMGSAMWTAASVNLSYFLQIPFAITMSMLGLFALSWSIVITKSFDLRRAIANICFMIPFSCLIGFFANFFRLLGVENLPLAVKIILDISGIFVLACGVSIYQRVNLFMHPIDEVIKNVRFYICHGKSRRGLIVSFIPPMMLIALLYWITGDIHAVNIGTLVSLLFQGDFVAIGDKYVFPSLKHHFTSPIQNVKS
ncbi:Uncharacterized membrane protein YczE [Granulicatella balaenopterae]|uniref:Uncharacterized membrane protein YczE n=1 Tax=Granulicatella balaenopterae TaxID=137733 RepID=A0A1H9JM90_9LACT|nr:hypothetical protein [Granulicatella balaenopterae]SEQ87899.1 Uncharacterized membrane protein YczE [Granulicatella balaenopterae]